MVTVVPSAARVKGSDQHGDGVVAVALEARVGGHPHAHVEVAGRRPRLALVAAAAHLEPLAAP